MRAAALLLATLPFLVAAGVEAAAGPAPTLAWRLAPSDVAVYDVTPVSWKEGKEARGAAAVRTVYGHDLRDGGQYVPVTPARADLPAVLALRLPASGDATSVELRLLPRDAPPTTAKGKVAARARDDGLLEVETSWTFSSAPPTERGTASLWVRGGTAHTVLAFDRAREVVVSSRVTLEYETRPASAKDGKPATVSGTWDLVLREVRRTRYEGFQAHVDAAIDRGVAWLRTQRSSSFWVCSSGPISMSRLSACSASPFGVRPSLRCSPHCTGTLRACATMRLSVSALRSSFCFSSAESCDARAFSVLTRRSPFSAKMLAVLAVRS